MSTVHATSSSFPAFSATPIKSPLTLGVVNEKQSGGMGATSTGIPVVASGAQPALVQGGAGQVSAHTSRKKSKTEQIQVDVAFDQGLREYMEDYRTTQRDPESGCSFYAVFDGHGDYRVAEWLSNNFHLRILPVLSTYQTAALQITDGTSLNKLWIQLEFTLKKLILDVELEMYTLFQGKDEVGGSTMAAVAFLPRAKRLVLLNLGDSHVVVSAAEPGQIRFATVEHKPKLSAERRRIRDSGGYLARGRVNGVLSLTRAFGDFTLKETTLANCQTVATAVKTSESDADAKTKQYHPGHGPVTTWCDVHTFHYSPRRIRFVIVASDGIWDVMDNLEALRYVAEAVACKANPAEALIHKALELDSGDNLTAIVIQVTES